MDFIRHVTSRCWKGEQKLSTANKKNISQTLVNQHGQILDMALLISLGNNEF